MYKSFYLLFQYLLDLKFLVTKQVVNHKGNQQEEQRWDNYKSNQDWAILDTYNWNTLTNFYHQQNRTYDENYFQQNPSNYTHQILPKDFLCFLTLNITLNLFCGERNGLSTNLTSYLLNLWFFVSQALLQTWNQPRFHARLMNIF